ncbi:oligoendopeptidase, pepF/M3 family [Virgibacillus subterraneus]|uniref:Oligoendopeptidase, pepF/M3 family n=1 Tax=Virgibacillus subterraneus TaxID=621109 RepID=A0A1H9JNQ0_9BACI|nr:M3 family oligoendopeptidase [Virgibacillus subterraneus]SEQ88409.1 oligoendopeptidase, pepF/M3 family [Virgibacillus subterraneus]
MGGVLYPVNWNLDSLFNAGSNSIQLQDQIEYIKKDVNNFEEKVVNLKALKDSDGAKIVAELIQDIENIKLHLSQISSFITCLLAEDVSDINAATWKERVSSHRAHFNSLVRRFQLALALTNDTNWIDIIESKELTNYQFLLGEWRKEANTLLSDQEENTISSLMVDGYHGWGDLYHSSVAEMRIDIPVEGKVKELAVGQARNLRSHENGEVRRQSAALLEKAWAQKSDTFATILNRIAGFRLQVYNRKGIQNVLYEPLKDNRMKEETLGAMWKVVNQHKQPFANYLNNKAKMLGKEKLPSFDFWAPANKSMQTIDYQDGVDFILNHFSRFGSELENFTRYAFNKKWVEAEDRSNKSAIAFCAGFPLSEESRVFMTYGGHITDVLTLAHELGHAFHNHAMNAVDHINRQYPMSIAETASTFAEMIVLDAAMEEADSPEERLFLLDEKLKRSVMNFMNIHSRFLFETRFYEERKKGMVSPSNLNQLMDQAIDEAYDGALEDIPAYTWASTPHFYITDKPFYNFPYTFGYLFALSVYAKGKEEGNEFETRYMALLRDSGSMSIEDLAMKHLEEDITQEGFWEKGMQLCIKDAEDFIQLAAEFR